MSLASRIKTVFSYLREPFLIIYRNWQLILEMAKREITDRYSGQVLGIFWTIGHPIVLMGVYVFIFAIVFKVKVGGTREMPLDYTTYLLSGLIPWLGFQESMMKGCTIITSNANLVKQCVFPIEVLPVKSVLASLITMLFNMIILIIYVLISKGTLFWTYSLLILLIIMQSTAMIGIGYIFASLGVYLRDLKDFVQVFCTIGMYLMPIFYLPASVPILFRPVLYLNPFSYLVWVYQDTLYFERIGHWYVWSVFLLLSIGIFYIGYYIFKKLSVMFGDVL